MYSVLSVYCVGASTQCTIPLLHTTTSSIQHRACTPYTVILIHSPQKEPHRIVGRWVSPLKMTALLPYLWALKGPSFFIISSITRTFFLLQSFWHPLESRIQELGTPSDPSLFPPRWILRLSPHSPLFQRSFARAILGSPTISKSFPFGYKYPDYPPGFSGFLFFPPFTWSLFRIDHFLLSCLVYHTPINSLQMGTTLMKLMMNIQTKWENPWQQ